MDLLAQLIFDLLDGQTFPGFRDHIVTDDEEERDQKVEGENHEQNVRGRLSSRLAYRAGRAAGKGACFSRLPSHNRVFDVSEACGGLRPSRDLSLARNSRLRILCQWPNKRLIEAGDGHFEPLQQRHASVVHCTATVSAVSKIA